MTTKQKGNDWQTLKRVIKLAMPFKNLFFLSLGLGILVSFVTPLRPYIIQLTVDNNIIKQNGKGLEVMGLILLLSLILEFLVKYLFGLHSTKLGQTIMLDLRTKLFNHVQTMRLKFFDKTPVGIITTRTINDIEAINNIFSEGLITIVADVLTLVFVITFMVYINWKLALVCLTTFPIVLIATYIFKEKVRVSFNDVRDKVAQLNSFVQEHISGMRIVQIFNAQEREFQKFDQLNHEHYVANDKSVLYYSIFFPVVEVILALAISLLIWYGANQVMNGFATVGIFTSFILYLNLAFRPLRMLADKFNTLQMGIIASERVFKLLDTNDKIEDNGTWSPTTIKGDIEFQHVWFAYNNEEFVLKDISFKVNAGETLAIVGATGSGKSSTINILNRFYEINKGKILLDGIDTKEYKLNNLRSYIGTVLQDVFLFSGSVMDNITLKNPAITEAQVIEASKLVGAHDFIMELPNGYQHNVMERGSTLSVGQRQLISFIRALVYNPQILILDEATSSVDTESENLIQHAIETLVKGRTSIVIAHRLSTIQNADKIMVLEQGEIKEIGTHDELLKKEDGYYKRLYEMQFQTERVA
ncbi:MAG TPA: ABC transporter ATP-binding protein [Chitinophagales bacterium]|jgi:ATP-binding cassette subfamily B multidrug efflux pump|nr:ABC transporter ATP-binding protein [Chitinophagales bacterium]HPN18483.1 ABC transporter ATP-binding protein [Chitinophagales bacterium]